MTTAVVYVDRGARDFSTVGLTTKIGVNWSFMRNHFGSIVGLFSLVSSLPDPRLWGMLVENFFRRQLTFDADLDLHLPEQ